MSMVSPGLRAAAGGGGETAAGRRAGESARGTESAASPGTATGARGGDAMIMEVYRCCFLGADIVKVQ